MDQIITSIITYAALCFFYLAFNYLKMKRKQWDQLEKKISHMQKDLTSYKMRCDNCPHFHAVKKENEE